MNIDKQDERLLHEILSKYKQGLISGILQGDNITLTPTGCRNKIISSTGGGGSSALFPNGIKYIVTGDAPAEPDANTVYLGDGIFEYELQAGDAGKLIIIKSSDITTYLPELTPFQINENVGITSMSGVVNVKVQFAIEDDPIEMLSGATNGCPINETVIFTNKIIDGENKIIPLSTIAIDKKTALKYLYDQSQNEQIITLGTVTFNDINAAPAISEISIPLNVIPSDYYAVLFFCEITAAFDFPSMGYVKAISGPFGDLTRDFTSIGKTVFSESSGFNIGGTLSANTINSIFNFDAGSGQVNPKNLTTGSATIKALIKKFPN